MRTVPAERRPFPADLFRVLRDLARHNDRPWFRSHKAEYEEHVLAPALAFVRTVAPMLERISPYLLADPRPVGGSVMRVYRDVRFSRDKTPFRTYVGIRFMHDGARNRDQFLPGFFLNLAPRDCWIYAGLWEPDLERLERIRRAIVARSAAWRAVREAVPPLEGPAVKRVPDGYAPDHPRIEDLKRTGFGSRIRLTESEVLQRDFPERFLRGCERLDPLNRFLARAVGVAYAPSRPRTRRSHARPARQA